jgi:hypothetical protein
MGQSLLLEPHRLLDGDLVERVHAHLDVGDVHAAAVGTDAHLHVGVDDALDRYQDLHPQCLSTSLAGAGEDRDIDSVSYPLLTRRAVRALRGPLQKRGESPSGIA